MHKQRLRSGHILGGKRALAAVALSALSFGACATDAPETADEAPAAETLEQRSGGSSLRDPRGNFIADVVANGTGCPAGTWQTQLSSDGQTFTTTFSGYETQVDRKTTVSVKDCTLTVKLHSSAGFSYQVQSFYYQGYAYLERGVEGRQTAQYYFQGDPASGSNAQTDLRGPYDRSYLFNDDVAIKNPWSPCGVDRNLNIITRIRLTNDGNRATGYMNLSAVDGSSKLVFKLGKRSCRGNNNGGSNNNGGWNSGNNGGWDDNNDDDNGWDDGNDDDRGNDRGNDGRGGWSGPSLGGPSIIDVDRQRL